MTRHRSPSGVEIDRLAAYMLGAAYELDGRARPDKIRELSATIADDPQLLLEVRRRIQQVDTSHETTRRRALEIVDTTLRFHARRSARTSGKPVTRPPDPGTTIPAS